MLDALYTDTKTHMEKCVESLKDQLSSLRTGKASPRMLDRIMVEAYGSRMPLNQVATIGTPEARLLTVTPFDKGQISAIEKAIMISDLGITPTSDGTVIRLPIPPLNEERRKEYVKQARKQGEDAKVSIRGVRRDANEQLKKAKGDSDITEDDLKRGTDQVQKLTDEWVKTVDQVLEAKEAEIMEV